MIARLNAPVQRGYSLIGTVPDGEAIACSVAWITPRDPSLILPCLASMFFISFCRYLGALLRSISSRALLASSRGSLGVRFFSLEGTVRICPVWGSANATVLPCQMISRSGPTLHNLTRNGSSGFMVATPRATTIHLCRQNLALGWRVTSPEVSQVTTIHPPV